jgi:hypothetical protein
MILRLHCRPPRPALLFAALLAAAPSLRAQSDAPPVGAPTFCLFEVPAANERRQWVNLAHVQYVEQRGDEIRIYFGGGNLGNGHEARLPARTADEAAAVLLRLRREAARCAGK